MSKRLFLKVFTLGFAVLVIAGCSQASPTFPTGEFIDTDGLITNLMADGRIWVRDSATGKTLIEKGRYSVDADTVTFSGGALCPPGGGVYKWTLDGNRLRFELIEDSCESRIAALSRELTRYTQGE